MNIAKIISTALLLAFLVWLIAFFAASETAYLSMTGIRIRHMLRQKKKGAYKVAGLRSDMDGLLTIILVGINFINTVASAIAAVLAIELAGDAGLGIATIAITFFVTVFGEIIPKTIAAENPDSVAIRNAGRLSFLKKIFFPIAWTFSKVSKGTAWIMEKVWKADETLITEEEIRTLIDEGEHDGALEKNERNMLNKIIEISDLHVHNIMKHRSLVAHLSIDAGFDQVVEAFKKTGYSHLPVFEDTDENITGVLFYKDVLFSRKKIPYSEFRIQNFMKQPLFVPETFSVIELIQLFKKENRSFAVALNEQGGTAGIVTMDDVLRSLFGRMSESNSIYGIAPEQRIKILSAKEFVVPGDMRLIDLNAVLNLNLDSEEYDTLGGWLMEHFDALPSTGEALRHDGTLFVVEDQSQRRVKSVKICKK